MSAEIFEFIFNSWLYGDLQRLRSLLWVFCMHKIGIHTFYYFRVSYRSCWLSNQFFLSFVIGRKTIFLDSQLPQEDDVSNYIVNWLITREFDVFQAHFEISFLSITFDLKDSPRQWHKFINKWVQEHQRQLDKAKETHAPEDFCQRCS